MIKRYCDCCGHEITDQNRIDDGPLNRLSASLKKGKDTVLRVEVIAAKDYTWNDGDFCKYCVIDAIKEADDRPDYVPGQS